MTSQKLLPAEAFETIAIEEQLAARREIAVIWCIQDVQQARPDLDDDQAWQVLQTVRSQHDAETGISYSTLEWAAFDLFGDAPADKVAGDLFAGLLCGADGTEEEA